MEEDKRGEMDFSKKAFRKVFSLFIVLLVVVISGFFVAESHGVLDNSCGDGTPYNTCSEDKPYFCNSEGILVKNASKCGCPEVLNSSEGICFSKYETGEETKVFDYYVHGEKGTIEMPVYKGVAEKLSKVSRSYDFGNSTPSKREVKINIIDNELQKVYLQELAKKIQNIDNSEVEQARIAISLVQRIPYGYTNKTIKLGGNEFQYSRYPYEVLYDDEGICGEKSNLLVFLLRELGFETIIFYFPLDNHEAVGIRCPEYESYYNSGYCFVETTAPSILSKYKNNYIGGVKLESGSRRIFISEGDSLPPAIDEYDDSKAWVKIRKIQEEKGEINFFRYHRKKALEEKYGLNGY